MGAVFVVNQLSLALKKKRFLPKRKGIVPLKVKCLKHKLTLSECSFKYIQEPCFTFVWLPSIKNFHSQKPYDPEYVYFWDDAFHCIASLPVKKSRF